MFIVMGFVLVWESDVDFASRIQAGEYLIFFFWGGGGGEGGKKPHSIATQNYATKLFIKNKKILKITTVVVELFTHDFFLNLQYC